MTSPTAHGSAASSSSPATPSSSNGSGGWRRRVRRLELVDDEMLFDFYADRLGPDVTSIRHFDRWWKATRRNRPDLLDLTDDVVAGGSWARRAARRLPRRVAAAARRHRHRAPADVPVRAGRAARRRDGARAAVRPEPGAHPTGSTGRSPATAPSSSRRSCGRCPRMFGADSSRSARRSTPCSTARAGRPRGGPRSSRRSPWPLRDAAGVRCRRSAFDRRRRCPNTCSCTSWCPTTTGRSTPSVPTSMRSRRSSPVRCAASIVASSADRGAQRYHLVGPRRPASRRRVHRIERST